MVSLCINRALQRSTHPPGSNMKYIEWCAVSTTRNEHGLGRKKQEESGSLLPTLRTVVCLTGSMCLMEDRLHGGCTQSKLCSVWRIPGLKREQPSWSKKRLQKFFMVTDSPHQMSGPCVPLSLPSVMQPLALTSMSKLWKDLSLRPQKSTLRSPQARGFHGN